MKDTTTEKASASQVMGKAWISCGFLWPVHFCSFNKKFEMSNSNWRLTNYIIKRTDARKKAFHPLIGRNKNQKAFFHPLIGRNKNQKALVHRHSMPFQKKTRHWTAWEPRVTRHDGKCKAMTDINATAGRSDIKSHSHLSVGRWMFT